ncbi:hypothetical protein CSKR_114300, partial [Clonorchis sinensis]
QLEREAAWCSTFSCLETSQQEVQLGYSLVSRKNQIDLQISNLSLTETRALYLPDEPQEGRNRSWAVEEFSATL